jgi:hypothetical protein
MLRVRSRWARRVAGSHAMRVYLGESQVLRVKIQNERQTLGQITAARLTGRGGCRQGQDVRAAVLGPGAECDVAAFWEVLQLGRSQTANLISALSCEH